MNSKPNVEQQSVAVNVTPQNEWRFSVAFLFFGYTYFGWWDSQSCFAYEGQGSG